MELAALLNKLPFHKISNDFMNYVIDKEFSEYRQLETIHIHNDTIIDDIKKTNQALREQFLQNAPSRNWRQLIEHDMLQYNKCLCLIFHLVNCGKKSSYKLTFECSGLYLLLTSLPLSRPMNIFYQNLYLKCIEVIQICSASRKSEYSPIRDKSCIINFLDHLKIAFKHFDLNDTYSLDNTSRILITTVVDLNSSMQELSFAIYDALYTLCDYYNTDDALFGILKYVSPFLSMSESNLNAHEQMINLKSLMDFISRLIRKFDQRISNILLKFVKRLTLLCAESSALSDLRRKRAVSVTIFVHILPSTYFQDYMKWFGTFAGSTKKHHRVFAQQIILQLLPSESCMIQAGPSTYTEEANRLNEITLLHKKVLMIIIERYYDTNDEVVTKAIQNLCEAFQIPHMNDLLMHMFSPEIPAVDISSLPTADEMNKVLLHYLREDKVSLRKAALQLLEHIAINKPRQWLNKPLKNQLVIMVRDSAVSVRQQALNVLTQFVNKYMTEDHGLVHTWLENVLPESSNTASGLDTRIYTEFAKLFLDNLLPFESIEIQSKSEIPWIILAYIQLHAWRSYLDEAIAYWISKKIIKPSVLEIMKTYINTKYNTEVMMFLASMAKTTKIDDVAFVVEYYNYYMAQPYSNKEKNEAIISMQYALQILSSKHGMSNEARYELSDNLIHQLTNWNVPVSLATDLMNTISYLQNSTSWREHYVEIACDTVKEGLSALQDDVPFDIRKFEIALLLYVENPTGIRKLPFRQLAVRLCHKLSSNEQSMIVHFHRETTLHKTMLLSLARLCLRDDAVAYTTIPAFFSILFRKVNVSIKVLCLIILKDMATLYIRTIEPYVDALLICLKAENEVRVTTTRVITELLADGYLKLCGDKMVCYLSMVLDEQKDVHNIVDYFLTQKASIQNKDLMLDLLMDTIYFHNNKSTSAILGKAFSLHGNEMIITRRKLYKYMVFNMREDAKFRVIMTLFTNILVPWGNAALSSRTDQYEMSILHDVFTILSFKDLKPLSIEAAGKNAEAEPESIEMEVEQVEDVAVDKKKMSLLETITPILDKFKSRLAKKSVNTTEYDTLNKICQFYILELSSDYKKQIKKLDPQLAKKVFGK